MNKEEKDIQKLIERKKLESAALKKILQSIHNDKDVPKRGKSGKINSVNDPTSNCQ